MATLISGLGGAAGFGENTFSTASGRTGNLDDGSINVNVSSVFGAVGINLYGTAYPSVFINTNGLLTFGTATPAYTSAALTTLGPPSIAPFWTDIDISKGGELYWDLDATTGRFIVTWLNVAAYTGPGTNSFQVVLTNLGGGDVNIDYIYGSIGFVNGGFGNATVGISNGTSSQTLVVGSGDATFLATYAGNDFDTEDPVGIWSISFAPPDTAAPTVSTFSPTDGATGVTLGSNIVVTFSETIARGTGNIELRVGSATGTIVETFNAASSTQLTLSGSQLTIDPTATLSNSTQYFVVMASGTIKDAAGNNYTGTSTYDFTTVAAGPTEGNDNLVGTASNETINGLGGNDTISGLGGNDTLVGGLGNDTLDGGTGNDVLTGGDGTDTASYVSATAGVTVSLALTTAQNTVGAGRDKLTTVENLTGSAFNDMLSGCSLANCVNGGPGDDLLIGRGGIDVLDGGEGSDVYLVTLLSDKTAAEVTDTGTIGADELRLGIIGPGSLVLVAGDTGLERVVIGTGTASEAVTTATTAIDVDATVSANALVITGNAGENTLIGSSFQDTLDGGRGHDVLLGGLGNDILIGGLGQDTLTGGIGNDVFKFKLRTESAINKAFSDTITDFSKGEDKIDLSVIDGFSETSANDTFDWKGTAAFNSTSKGEVRYQQFDNPGAADDYTMIWIDNDRDTEVEMAIRLSGLHDLTASDFIL